MKKRIKLLIFIMVTSFSIIALNADGDRCEDTCVPETGGTCSYGTGDSENPVEFCSGWANMAPIRPIDFIGF